MSRREYAYSFPKNSSNEPIIPAAYRVVGWITSVGSQASFKLSYNMKSLSTISMPGYYAEVMVTGDNIAEAANNSFLCTWGSGYTDWGLAVKTSNTTALPGKLCLRYVVSGGSTTWYDLGYNTTNDCPNFTAGMPKGFQAVKVTTNSSKQISVVKADGTSVSNIATLRNRYDYGQYIGVFNSWENNKSWGASRSSNLSIRRLVLYNGTTVKYDLYPVVRVSDDVAGMYDVTNSVFHPSETSTAFIVEGY